MSPSPGTANPASPDDPQDIRPVVALPLAGLSNVALGLVGLTLAGLLFWALEANRRSASAPDLSPVRIDAAPSAAPPPLYIPPGPQISTPPLPLPSLPPSNPVQSSPRPISPPIYQPPQPQVAPALQPPGPPVQRAASGPAIVADNGGGLATSPGSPGEAAGDRLRSGARVTAGVFSNRATTVPQGTLIAAVLETGFNSTQPGFARALVQHDIRGFDGTRVLIPRGSRLIGDYGSAVSAGQNRAMIIWTRLIRPDGATVELESPATDPVGRGGVRASVNSHFLERFGGALLQSSLDIGANLAARAADSQVIVALPGSLQGATNNAVRPAEVRPTLKVAPGTSVSVFVARDLDFTSVEERQ